MGPTFSTVVRGLIGILLVDYELRMQGFVYLRKSLVSGIPVALFAGVLVISSRVLIGLIACSF